VYLLKYLNYAGFLADTLEEGLVRDSIAYDHALLISHREFILDSYTNIVAFEAQSAST